VAALVHQALRARCAELAVYLHAGVLPLELLEEVTELSRKAWALRESDDA